jgi:hypothetical protein
VRKTRYADGLQQVDGAAEAVKVLGLRGEAAVLRSRRLSKAADPRLSAGTFGLLRSHWDGLHGTLTPALSHRMGEGAQVRTGVVTT